MLSAYKKVCRSIQSNRFNILARKKKINNRGFFHLCILILTLPHGGGILLAEVYKA